MAQRNYLHRELSYLLLDSIDDDQPAMHQALQQPAQTEEPEDEKVQKLFLKFLGEPNLDAEDLLLQDKTLNHGTVLENLVEYAIKLKQSQPPPTLLKKKSSQYFMDSTHAFHLFLQKCPIRPSPEHRSNAHSPNS